MGGGEISLFFDVKFTTQNIARIECILRFVTAQSYTRGFDAATIVFDTANVQEGNVQANLFSRQLPWMGEMSLLFDVKYTQP